MEKELDKVKTALDDFRKKVVDVVKKGKGEADRVAKFAHVKLEIGSLNRQRKDLFEELGEAFYRGYQKPGKRTDEAVAGLVANLTEVEKRTASLKRDLKAQEKEPSKAPKRRGRPPKPAAEKAGAVAPKRRGRPPKSASKSRTAKGAAPKRRGRPPKSAPPKSASKE